MTLTAPLLTRFAVALGVAALPRLCPAFTVRSAATAGCHEALVREAVSVAGWPAGRVPPALSDLDRRVARDLPLDREISDLWTLGLIIGIRHDDLGGLAETDLAALAALHGDPAAQSEHCLRAPEHDGVTADRDAVAACRAVIRSRLAEALGAGDEPDLEARQQVVVALVSRGRIAVPVSRYAFNLGRALHGLQDSFSHLLRSPDGAVRAATNMVDWLHGYYDPARDGPPHLRLRDACDSPQGPHGDAIAASTELLRAVNDAADGRAGRLSRVDAVLARHLQYQPGCDHGNGWCGAPLSGCSVSGAGAAPLRAAGRAPGLLLLGGGAAVLARRRRGLAAALTSPARGVGGGR